MSYLIKGDAASDEPLFEPCFCPRFDETGHYGGEVAGYTKLLADSRNQARERLIEEARRLGANAVVATRFDCNEIGDIMSEVAAYGTAVTIVPLQEPGASS